MLKLLAAGLLALPIYLGMSLTFFWIFSKEENTHERALNAMVAAGFFLYVLCLLGWASGCVCPV